MRDTNIWRELPPTDDGFIPAVPREWMFTGRRLGVDCRFPVRLTAKHPSLPDTYSATAVFAHNVNCCCRDWVKLSELSEA